MSERKLKKASERDAERMEEAERNRPRLIAQTAYLGSLALLFIIPVVGGAYLGRWIDSLFEGYSVRWTVSMIILGIVIGFINVHLFIRERS